MNSEQFLTIQCRLLRETDKALHLHWDDEENGMDLQFWIPKKCIEEDEFDRAASVKQLKESREPVLIDVAIWWLREQDWFDETIEELIELE